MSEDDSLLTIDIPGDNDFEKAYRDEQQAAVRKKDELISGALIDGRITPQMADFLKGVETSTMGAASSNLHKVELILAMKDILAAKNIKDRKTVSLYSGFDWRFPVALGARDLTMVDSGFSQGWLTPMLVESVREYDPEMTQEGEEIRFNVDTGSGKEIVRLHLEPSDVSTYSPAGEIDFIIESHGSSGGLHNSPLPTLPDLIQFLSDGALIYNDRYGHDDFFTSDLGLSDIGFGGQHFYEVIDKEKMMSSSAEIVRPGAPSLEHLRQIAQSHKDSQS